ncbi:hypothetical protein [Caballeronia sp. ATUFL_F1_KS4A]|uniref:hypothetical protein n=1 Tax=Caballeronia sp. ATUFL_F1_KS4A TaxID=2921768 RepID=UPI00202837B5|nr:hypothetical protein [Caballeronia sp. ATUFL_F1_KS4A]
MLQLIAKEGGTCKGCPHERTYEFIGSMRTICATGKDHGYRCEQYGKRNPMTKSAIAADEIDVVLTEWYEWSQSYEPAVGYGRASAMFRDCRSSRQWMTYDELGEDVDNQLRATTGEAVEPIIAALSLTHRIAVMTAVRNFVAGAVVFENPRSPATQERDYSEAKAFMRPALVAKNLIRKR